MKDDDSGVTIDRFEAHPKTNQSEILSGLRLAPEAMEKFGERKQ